MKKTDYLNPPLLIYFSIDTFMSVQINAILLLWRENFLTMGNQIRLLKELAVLDFLQSQKDKYKAISNELIDGFSLKQARISSTQIPKYKLPLCVVCLSILQLILNLRKGKSLKFKRNGKEFIGKLSILRKRNNKLMKLSSKRWELECHGDSCS